MVEQISEAHPAIMVDAHDQRKRATRACLRPGCSKPSVRHLGAIAAGPCAAIPSRTEFNCLTITFPSFVATYKVVE